MPARIRPEKEKFLTETKGFSPAEVAEKYDICRNSAVSWMKLYGTFEPEKERLKNPIGSEINGWVIVSRAGNNRSGCALWNVKCRCGKMKIKTTGHLKEGQSTNCGCKKKGVYDLNNRYWNGVAKCAKRRGIPFHLTIKDGWELFQRQDAKCALTGWPLKFGKDRTASLDRIDSKKDYSLDNIQWVHNHVNWMKNKFSQEYFIAVCASVTENKTKKD